jgi:dTDP-4-amino-4,6-dideoxygalactose transaminase
MKNKFNDFAILKEKKRSIPLFYPYISKRSKYTIKEVLSSRWIGQGPLVDKFEKIFKKKFCNNLPTIAVGSGTDALHLAYLLAGIKKNDEVICPVFTCTATNIPLLYIGAKIKFADIDPYNFNISIEHVKKLITKKTKAIIFVNYGGLLCDLDELNTIAKKNKIILIQDAAQSLGSKYNKKEITQYADFTIFSFQAIKHITSGDGGALCFKNKKLLKKALRLRWFGIDREKKQNGTWENDITEIGYKYQMTDIAARLLIDSIKDFKFISRHRNQINQIYINYFKKNPKIRILLNKDKKADSCIWLATIITDKKDYVQKELRKLNIESNQVHFRNDKYSIFKKFINNSKFKNMQNLENKYLVLPCHTNMTLKQAKFIAKSINKITK